MLAESGIDTTTFKGHSTRAAATSAACLKGASISDVMQTAGWSRSTTFERFYHKEIENKFEETVLKDN